MNLCDESVYCGYITKKEILTRLAQNDIMTEENLKPIQQLRETQYLNLDTEEFYKQLFEKCSKQEKELEDYVSYNSEDDSNLNDTLAEMEAFMLQGTEYALSKESPLKNLSDDFSFIPKISSTVTDHNDESKILANSSQNSELSNYAFKKRHSSDLKNVSNIDWTNLTNMNSNDSKLSDRHLRSLETIYVTNKYEIKTPVMYRSGSENNLCSPEIIFTPNNYPQKTSLFKNTPENPISVKSIEKNNVSKPLSNTPKSTKENNPNSAQKTKEIFKTPLPKLKTNYKNIVSPISRYISESPTVPLMQKITPKTIPFSEHRFKTSNLSLKKFAQLPEVYYKPAKMQEITFEDRAKPLPKCFDKYISKPLRPEIIKHKGRKNVKNEFEEYFETCPIDLKIEDFSQFIDMETSRMEDISVMVSSEAKFSSHLKK